MNRLKIIAIFLLPIIAGCNNEYIDTALTSHLWNFNSVEERGNFGWKEVQNEYSISTIRFYRDYGVELKYLNDTAVYYGDWTEYYHDVYCPENDCGELRLLVVNLYHDSPFPTVFEVECVSSNELVMISEENGYDLKFTFER